MRKEEDNLSVIEFHENQTFLRIIPTALRVDYSYSLVSKSSSRDLNTIFWFQVMSLLSLVCFHIIPLFVLIILNTWTFIKVQSRKISEFQHFKNSSLGSQKQEKVLSSEPEAQEGPDHGHGSNCHCPHLHLLSRLQICHQSG